MRNFLKDVHIVGGVGVWSEGEIIRHCIENLLKYCDHVFLTMDYSDDKTKGIVMEYKNKYPEQITVGDTSARVGPPNRESYPAMMGRQKTFCGDLIQCNFDMVKEYHEKVKKVDILIFMDSDEILTDNIPNVLEEFWKSTIDTVFIKPIEVFMDMHIICNKGLVSHAKIYKYVPEISAKPYSQQNFYLPYRRNRNIMKASWNFCHLARLNTENRKLRSALRNNQKSDPEMKLRRVSKPAYELTPKEAEIVDNSEKFVRLKDWNGEINSVPLVL